MHPKNVVVNGASVQPIKSNHIPLSLGKQRGSMVVMAIFIIVVVSLLAAAMIKIVSASSDSTIQQVYGLRAHQAAKAGIEDLMLTSFPTNGSIVACNTSTASVPAFSNIKGLAGCRYAATCATQTIVFNSVERMHFQFTSTGSCDIDTNVVSRTLSVDAVQEVNP